ncbi:XRE family transcriptional regulator [Shewanella sp. AS1]|uniref:XRE family transcriptional regulator n=1 Tax=Shewanella sp. AS1 TaxID=2907626 RepID=UPI001F22FAFC|nr:XRE family transcriptional regulator [Shewanella sp. AS1]MCE9679202.1 XRE family transcriptional regulator [Shewanella sp. AS1]
MAQANINTKMLKWARERVGFAVPEFAKKCGIKPERLEEWEAGQAPLTFNQAMTFADKAHIPFGYLFLPTPPADELPIPDLRTLGGEGVFRPSAELLDIVKLMQERQAWYKDYLKQQLAEPCQVVGRFSVKDGKQAVVADMRKKLGVAEHPSRGKWVDYYRDLVSKIEFVGILVMRQSDLGHFTRPLLVSEFRGFAISDDYAPIIFVNHADAPGARLFTLIHELCHIWLGKSGVSDGNTQNHRQEEVFCNAVAAEFLVPEHEFVALWQNGCESWQDNLGPLEAHFHVSTWVLARRALTVGFITEYEYSNYIATQKAINKNKGDGGPTYYRTKKSQISQSFSKAIIQQAMSGQMLMRDAGFLLGNMKPAQIPKFAKEFGF